ncbi:MAG: hypothetical protein ACXWP5_00660, partial [Bdellovibrionota bacterium]
MGQAVVLEQDPAAGTPVNRSLLSFGLETEAPIENVMGWLLQVVLARGPTFGMPLDEAAREIET